MATLKATTIKGNLTTTGNAEVDGTLTVDGKINGYTLGNVSTLNTNASTSNFLRGDGTWVTPPNAVPNNGTLTMKTKGTGLSGFASFTANQSGASEFEVESNATSANTGGTIVARDASGDFSARTITATLKGGINPGTITGGNTFDPIYVTMADNDYFRIRVGGNTSSGYVELATANEGTEPIYVRQYNGVFTTPARTLTLLNGSGNTILPGNLTVGGTIVASSGQAVVLDNDSRLTDSLPPIIVVGGTPNDEAFDDMLINGQVDPKNSGVIFELTGPPAPIDVKWFNDMSGMNDVKNIGYQIHFIATGTGNRSFTSSASSGHLTSFGDMRTIANRYQMVTLIKRTAANHWYLVGALKP